VFDLLAFMMDSNQKEKREIIVAHFLENPEESISLIARKLKFPKTTVYDVIKRFRDSCTVERRRGSGRKPGPVNATLCRKITRSFKLNPGLSDRDRAKRYGTSHTFVRKLRLKAGYKSFRAKNIQIEMTINQKLPKLELEIYMTTY
jgi:DNA invertase Pin-like site-specific DNA recombinase